MRSAQQQTAGEPPVACPGNAWRRVSGCLVRSSVVARCVTSATAATLLVLTGCDSLTKSDQLPTGVTDPAVTQTPQGALQVYRGEVAQFRNIFGGSPNALEASGSTDWSDVVAMEGQLSDELQNAAFLGVVIDRLTAMELSRFDRRSVLANGTDAQVAETYGALQKVRGQASQAVGLLQDYLPDSMALRGHAYALAGYAEVFLAELFCSGIPLSTLDYKGNYTPQPGSNTAAVFTHAATLFDSTLAYAGDNAAFMDLARVGKARALLGLGDYTQAATVAGAVADDYTYAVTFSSNSVFGPGPVTVAGSWNYSVADREGLNGLDYISSGDPRTAVQDVNARQIPAKYMPFDGSSPIVLASGVEARLIEAEAALQQGSAAWLDKLNALRTDGTQETVSANDPNDPNATTTQWRAGTGGVAGLAPLADPDPSAAPGPTNSRVDLLFRERAFWLFLTGHRLGDLRRLVRQYNRQADAVYPSGPYYQFDVFYGGTIALPIPDDERKTNPLFTGSACAGA